jgi:gamma-glutamyl:cysteine ligase YbdK (ATP-grasp superfamily)
VYPYPGRQTARGLAEDVARLLERMAPIAKETGDAEFLGSLQSQEKWETGSDQLRSLYRQTGDWQALIEEMKNRWGRELEEGEVR